MIKKPQGICLVVFLFLLLLLELKHISPEPFRQHIGLTPFILSFFNPHRMKILLPQLFKIIFSRQFINLQFFSRNKKTILKCLMHHCIFPCQIIDYKILIRIAIHKMPHNDWNQIGSISDSRNAPISRNRKNPFIFCSSLYTLRDNSSTRMT